MACVDALKVEHEAVVGAGYGARAHDGTVEPLGVVSVEGEGEDAAGEAVADLERVGFLVDSVIVDDVAGVVGCESVGEERSAADVAGIEEDVVVSVYVVVCSALDLSAEEVDLVGLAVCVVVVEMVVAPVGGIAHGTGEDEVEFFLKRGVFNLSVDAFLKGVALEVAVDDVAYAEVLVLPVGVGGSGVVDGAYALTVGVVHEVCAAVEVGNLVVVVAYIVAEVDTAGDGETVVVLKVPELLVVRYESVPLVAVVALTHHHVGACGAGCVHILHLAIVEGAIRAAVIPAEHSGGADSVPCRTIVGSTALAAESIAGGDGGVDAGGP